MGEKILQIEKISKRYRYGTIGTGSLRQDLNRWWQERVLKKENAFFRNAMDKPESRAGGDYFWALRNISFDLNVGDVLGIIGHNGAGKSTLLKILSRITRPTLGTIRGNGKVSSLLEVGTGFQPELTGRENIFISGHILGMSKKEITAKFDEIVDFSGVSDFIDTPVKRYSSGMYMRLAFAVAAHLDPDILIVDEVLAVGDAEFQKKCMNKMQEVSHKQGRTIIFVSHNLQAIENLCNKTLWLQQGRMKKMGGTSEVINLYTESYKQYKVEQEWETEEHAPGADGFKMKCVKIKARSEDEQAMITVKTPIQVDVEFWSGLEGSNINVNFTLSSITGECIFSIGSPVLRAQKGIVVLTNIIPGNLLNNGSYTLSFTVMKNSYPLYEFPRCIVFEVEDDREGINYFGPWPGVIRPQIDTLFYVKEPYMQPYL